MQRFWFLPAVLSLGLLFGLAPAQTSAPSLPPKGYRTLFMPLSGQDHDTGARSASDDLRWITTWAAQNKKGSLAKTQAVPVVPKGSYRAIFEIYYKAGKGNKLGNIRVWNAGKILASKDVIGEDYPNHVDGGYQRAYVDFDLASSGTNVQLEFDYFNNHYVWLGAISMNLKNRPFYLMRHRANNQSKLDQAVKDGANGIEIDIHPYGKSKDAALYEFYGYHYGDINYTVPDKFDALLTQIKKHTDSGKIVVFVMDCKQTFVDAAGLIPYGSADLTKYGKSLAAKVKKAGIPASKLMLSVPATNAGTLKKAFADAGYDVALDAYVESGGSGKETDWDGIKKWGDGVAKEKATFQGVGLDEAVRGPFYRYAYRLNHLISQRDNPAVSGTTIKKVYFWTVNNAKETRQLLDYGVDGILTDEVQRIKDVLKEPAYQGLFRLANASDRLDTVHHAGTLAATPARVVKPLASNARFTLSGDGKVFSEFYSGRSYYYPQVRADKPETLQFGGGTGPLKYGDTLKILTTNTNGWKASWKDHNQLGTFKDGVYYYKYGADDRVMWKIVSASGVKDGEVVSDGDTIRLFNVSYKQYLYRKGDITSTKSADDAETAWTLTVK